MRDIKMRAALQWTGENLQEAYAFYPSGLTETWRANRRFTVKDGNGIKVMAEPGDWIVEDSHGNFWVTSDITAAAVGILKDRGDEAVEHVKELVFGKEPEEGHKEPRSAVVLPNWEECKSAVDNEAASPLQELIYAYEPSSDGEIDGETNEERFRRLLTKVIEEARGE